MPSPHLSRSLESVTYKWYHQNRSMEHSRLDLARSSLSNAPRTSADIHSSLRIYQWPPCHYLPIYLAMLLFDFSMGFPGLCHPGQHYFQPAFLYSSCSLQCSPSYKNSEQSKNGAINRILTYSLQLHCMSCTPVRSNGRLRLSARKNDALTSIFDQTGM